MRIAVLTDVHGNLPALEAALAAIRAEGCDAVFHTGDAIAIGPYPAECVAALLAVPDISLLLGNHETYLVDGLPEPRPDSISEGEVEHQLWVRAQIPAPMREAIARWPYAVEREVEGVRVAFMHSGLGASGRDIQPIPRDAGAADLDALFAAHAANLLFYGHRHEPSGMQGRARYVNPGSLGCGGEAVARYCLADLHHGRTTVERRAVPYDDAPLFRAFEQRAVPDRQLIYRAFFGGRFHSPGQ